MASATSVSAYKNNARKPPTDRLQMEHCLIIKHCSQHANQVRVTRFQQPGTRFLNRVISQLSWVLTICTSNLVLGLFGPQSPVLRTEVTQPARALHTVGQIGPLSLGLRYLLSRTDFTQSLTKALKAPVFSECYWLSIYTES